MTASLYIKNLDRKVERADLVERLLPLFKNERGRVEEEVEIVVMKKGKMRGQGFMNFKRAEDA